jgi:hypothetical protein
VRGEIQVEHRLFHWLRERIELDEGADDLFHGAFRDAVDSEGNTCLGEAREHFPEWFARHRSIEVTKAQCGSCSRGSNCNECDDTGTLPGDDSLFAATGVCGEGAQLSVNTYKDPNLLAQTLLFTYFELRAIDRGFVGAYVVVQVHGGCDVRGGYSVPHVFRVLEPEDLRLFDYARGSITCDNEHSWSTDDANHWYREGVCGVGAGQELQRYPARAIHRHAQWREGELCVLTSGRALCPLCGGSLHASA